MRPEQTSTATRAHFGPKVPPSPPETGPKWPEVRLPTPRSPASTGVLAPPKRLQRAAEARRIAESRWPNQSKILSATEAQGRIHTSACTVAILPEADEIDVNIDDGDLRIDTYRASGAGGQHVNKTESAIRITHVPSGIVVTCQDERSQQKNRSRAMKVLSAKLLEMKQVAADTERAADRKAQVGSGDRSERIRTYNFPQNRLTDHRIGLTLYRLDAVMMGDLDPVLQPLLDTAQAELMAREGMS